jgi:hypothetical protein
MYIRFGKHRGETAESVVLKHPDFITWVLAQKPATEGFAELVQEFCRLIERFDSLPILTRCHEAGCAARDAIHTLLRGDHTILVVRHLRPDREWCAAQETDPLADVLGGLSLCGRGLQRPTGRPGSVDPRNRSREGTSRPGQRSGSRLVLCVNLLAVDGDKLVRLHQARIE